jgi:hypothetical protein
MSSSLRAGYEDARRPCALPTASLVEGDRMEITGIGGKVARTVLVAAAVAATLVSAAAAGTDTARQRVAITSKDETFVLDPLQAGALERDSGSNTSPSIPNPVVVMRGGQRVEVYRPTFTLKGKQGTLTIREQIDWVDTGGPQIGYGTWKVVRGTGAYARTTGSGRTAHAGLDHGQGTWYIRREGFLTTR